MAWVVATVSDTFLLFGSTGFKFFAEVSSSGVVFGTPDNTGNWLMASAPGITVGRCTHLAFTWSRSSSTKAIYIDGAERARLVSNPSQVSAISTDAGTFVVGGRPFNTFLTGVVDEVKVFSRALTAQEIQSARTANQPTNGLWGHWTFDNSDTADSSGNGRTGIIYYYATNSSSGVDTIIPGSFVDNVCYTRTAVTSTTSASAGSVTSSSSVAISSSSTVASTANSAASSGTTTAIVGSSTSSSAPSSLNSSGTQLSTGEQQVTTSFIQSGSGPSSSTTTVLCTTENCEADAANSISVSVFLFFSVCLLLCF